jgi:hypothetical protein
LTEDNIAQEQTGVNVVSYQCPNCGGPLHFGDQDTTECDHCGREIQKIPPPIQMTQPIGPPDGDDKKKGAEEFQGSGGYMPFNNWLLWYIILAHSSYTSAYTATSPAHPGHAHGVGGFAG